MKMVMESWVLMSLRGQWRIRYVSCSFFFFGTWGVLTKALHVLAKTCSHALCLSSVYLPTLCLSPTFHVYLLHFSGYCKANDARRFILDVANARWPLTNFNRLNHSADNRFTHTYQRPLLVALTITHTIDNIDICCYLLLNINPIWLHLFHSQLTTIGILHTVLFCWFQKQK